MENIEIFKLDKGNIESFMHLLPAGFGEELKSPGQYALGCVYREDPDSDEDRGEAAGVLCFFKQKRRIIIRHLLVQSKWRRRGIGRALLGRLYSFAGDTKADTIDILIPRNDDEEYKSLLPFIDEFTGYVPGWSKNFITSIGELKTVEIKTGRERSATVPLSRVPAQQFSRFVRSIPYDRKTGRECEISGSPDFYDTDVSMIDYRDDEICGMLLVKKGMNNIISPLMLYIQNKAAVKGIPDMIKRSIRAASEKYDDDTFVYFGSYIEKDSVLYDNVFSKLDVIPVTKYRLNIVKEIRDSGETDEYEADDYDSDDDYMNW